MRVPELMLTKSGSCWLPLTILIALDRGASGRGAVKGSVVACIPSALRLIALKMLQLGEAKQRNSPILTPSFRAPFVQSFLGAFIMILLVAYHFVAANPKFEQQRQQLQQ